MEQTLIMNALGGRFLLIVETTRIHIFSIRISQVMLGAMNLTQKFCC